MPRQNAAAAAIKAVHSSRDRRPRRVRILGLLEPDQAAALRDLARQRSYVEGRIVVPFELVGEAVALLLACQQAPPPARRRRWQHPQDLR